MGLFSSVSAHLYMDLLYKAGILETETRKLHPSTASSGYRLRQIDKDPS